MTSLGYRPTQRQAFAFAALCALLAFSGCNNEETAQGPAYKVQLVSEETPAAEGEAAECLAEEPAEEAPPLPEPRLWLEVEGAAASTEAEMQPYTEIIEHTRAKIDMVPIPGGTFLLGSPASEADRLDDEGPQVEVTVEPFWMSTCEITWDAYDVWMFDLDIQRRELARQDANPFDMAAEEFTLSQPTLPYTDMTFGMGKKGYPAISMTQFSARVFCMWLTAKTGRYYRLPTEAEWEYACRAGSTTAYSFGDDPDDLDDFAWSYENSDDRYHKVGELEPNAWGLYDMHGNVAEWVLDGYVEDQYGQWAESDQPLSEPLSIPTAEYPRIVRGGSWDDDPEMCRSASRAFSEEDWKRQDPQTPKSIWYLTDAQHVGFRIVRPLTEPTPEEIAAKWDAGEPVFDRHSGRHGEVDGTEEVDETQGE